MAKKENDEVTESKRLAKPGVTVELVTGEQWVDDLSGISLYRGFYRLVGKDEMRTKESKELGYIKGKEMQPTAVLPDDVDLSRVEKALRLGILKIYDPKNPTVYVERKFDRHKRVYDKDQGSKYFDEDDEKLENFLKLKFEQFKVEVDKLKNISTLEKLYDAECEGMNALSAPRKAYIDVIKKKIKDKKNVGGVTKITEKFEETVKIG